MAVSTDPDREPHATPGPGCEDWLAPPPRRVDVLLRLACLFRGTAPSCGWFMLFLGLGAVGGAVAALPDLAGLAFAVTILAIVLWGLVTLYAVALVVGSFVEGFRAIRRLSHGELGTGPIARHKSINRGIWEIGVDLSETKGEPLEVTVGVGGEDVLDLARPRRVLYDPADHTLARNFDLMAGAARLDGRGGFRRPPLGGLLASLMFPLLTILFCVRCLVAGLSWLLLP